VIKNCAEIQFRKRLIALSFLSIFGVLAMHLARAGLSLLCCLVLLCCSKQPVFQDPAQAARYQQYRTEVSAAQSEYYEALLRQPVPMIRAMQQFESFQQQWDNLGDAPMPAPMRQQFANLVDTGARSSDELTQLLGLVGVKACRFVNTNQGQLSENQDLLAFSALCSELPKQSYPFKEIPEFVELAEFFMLSGVLNQELDNYKPLTDAQKSQRDSALTPLLLRRSWQDSSAWFADLQLRAWAATAFAKDVPAPEEFQNYQVSQVEIVFDPLKFFISIDLYAQTLVEMVQAEALDLSQSQRRRLLLIVLGNSKNLDALASAESEWNAQNFAETDLPADLIKVRAELEELKDTRPFQNLVDLNDLKRRLEIVNRSGTLELAQRVKRGR
jgi:hypothetical protein